MHLSNTLTTALHNRKAQCLSFDSQSGGQMLDACRDADYWTLHQFLNVSSGVNG